MPSGAVDSGSDPEATVGRDYGREVFENANTVEILFAVDLDTTSVIIQAPSGNAGVVFLGFDDQLSTDNGFRLEAGDVITIDVNVAEQNIRGLADTANDEVRFMAIS